MVQKALGKKYVGVFSDVVPDTGLHIVNAGAEYGRKLEADVLVSVGGGSVIDTAKGMAICLAKGEVGGPCRFQHPQWPRHTPHRDSDHCGDWQ